MPRDVGEHVVGGAQPLQERTTVTEEPSGDPRGVHQIEITRHGAVSEARIVRYGELCAVHIGATMQARFARDELAREMAAGADLGPPRREAAPEEPAEPERA
jgi:hypothetical protein